MKKYILALDQGTTSSRAILFDETSAIVAVAQREFTQIFPEPGWVEHNPEEIWSTQWAVTNEVIAKAGIRASEILSIGITNQRETTVIWNKTTGKPVYNAIVWQDRRTASICESLRGKGLEEHVRKCTGLVIDAYFSGTKIKWILDHVEGARSEAEKGNLVFGTIDTWLLWKLTRAEVHATDVSNASRTLLFDIKRMCWDETMMQALDVPASMLPVVKDSCGVFGYAEIDGVKIPVGGIAGDQQAALFGQACFNPGMAKNTYGTGCFMLMNTGTKAVESRSGLVTTVAWRIDGVTEYALEGSIFIAGAAIQWLRDGLKLFSDARETEKLALSATADQVVVVPAFAGLGAPYWDMYARGAIFGLTRDAGIPEITRATLQSMAFQTHDVLQAMQKDSGLRLASLNVDGGACANNYLMQFQSDILNTPVERPGVIESTALGAALLAGISCGLWTRETAARVRSVERRFEPSMETDARNKFIDRWAKAVERVKGWEEQ